MVTYSLSAYKHLLLMHVAIIWHCDMIDLNVQRMTPIALHSNASYYPHSQVLCAIVHYKIHWNPSIVDPSIVENPSLIDKLGLTNEFFTT